VCVILRRPIKKRSVISPVLRICACPLFLPKEVVVISCKCKKKKSGNEVSVDEEGTTYCEDCGEEVE
jgi:hypothetical protein